MKIDPERVDKLVSESIEVHMIGADGVWTCRLYTLHDNEWPEVLEKHGPGARKRLSKLAAGELGESESLLSAWAELKAYEGCVFCSLDEEQDNDEPNA